MGRRDPAAPGKGAVCRRLRRDREFEHEVKVNIRSLPGTGTREKRP